LWLETLVASIKQQPATIWRDLLGHGEEVIYEFTKDLKVKTQNDLIRVKTLLRSGLPLPPDLAAWIVNGINAFQSGDCKTLCGALGLRRPGQSSAATREKLQHRNACIVSIAKTYDGSEWDQARSVAECIRKWPYISAEEKPLYGYLHSLGVNIPTTPNMIHKILTQLN
jgi:hypothetical protein